MSDAAIFGQRLAPRELEVLAEVAQHGDVRQAAACIGLRYQTAKNLVARAHTKTGTSSTLLTFAELGWLTVPPQLAHPIDTPDLLEAAEAVARDYPYVQYSHLVALQRAVAAAKP